MEMQVSLFATVPCTRPTRWQHGLNYLYTDISQCMVELDMPACIPGVYQGFQLVVCAHLFTSMLCSKVITCMHWLTHSHTICIPPQPHRGVHVCLNVCLALKPQCGLDMPVCTPLESENCVLAVLARVFTCAYCVLALPDAIAGTSVWVSDLYQHHHMAACIHNVSTYAMSQCHQVVVMGSPGLMPKESQHHVLFLGGMPV